MLEENARVALMIGETLRDQTIQMGLYEMENLLNRCTDMRTEFPLFYQNTLERSQHSLFPLAGSERLW